jgi:peptide-methionine (R)-S-oxide reductase
MDERIHKKDEDWRRDLTPEQYAVARGKGTEPAFTGRYWDCKEDGVYRCVCCSLELFHSDAKFDSGTGWPSFSDPVHGKNIRTEVDASHGMVRTEVLCMRCDAHLGHVFEDGPGENGLRYCINSVCLELERS